MCREKGQCDLKLQETIRIAQNFGFLHWNMKQRRQNGIFGLKKKVPYHVPVQVQSTWPGFRYIVPGTFGRYKVQSTWLKLQGTFSGTKVTVQYSLVPNVTHVWFIWNFFKKNVSYKTRVTSGTREYLEPQVQVLYLTHLWLRLTKMGEEWTAKHQCKLR